MSLSVYVLGREVATLEPSGDFKSVLTYHPGVAPDDFVSLTMPVRTESYVWDDQLPPVLQMNLPEGYLLQVLQEQLGPHIGASPAALLSVVGRNMVGRLQVAAPSATLSEPAKPIEVAALLKGDNSEAAFAALVREHATSGVSGVVTWPCTPALKTLANACCWLGATACRACAISACMPWATGRRARRLRRLLRRPSWQRRQTR